MDKSKLQNKYVVIINGKIVAQGEDIEKILSQVRKKYLQEIPFVAKLLDERMVV